MIPNTDPIFDENDPSPTDEDIYNPDENYLESALGKFTENQPVKQEKTSKNLNETKEEDAIKDDYNFDGLKQDIWVNTDLTQENLHDDEDDNDFDDYHEDKRSSPVLDKESREKLINFGHSLDSKQLADALGYIDLRYLLRWFAKAVNKHIEFSKGYLFMDDLKMEESRN